MAILGEGNCKQWVAGHLVTGPMSKPSFGFLCQCHHGIAQVGDTQSWQALQTFPTCALWQVLTATTHGQGPAKHGGCLASCPISAEGLSLPTAAMLRYRHPWSGLLQDTKEVHLLRRATCLVLQWLPQVVFSSYFCYKELVDDGRNQKGLLGKDCVERARDVHVSRAWGRPSADPSTPCSVGISKMIEGVLGAVV